MTMVLLQPDLTGMTNLVNADVTTHTADAIHAQYLKS
jgi:hypothetical protein